MKRYARDQGENPEQHMARLVGLLKIKAVALGEAHWRFAMIQTAPLPTEPKAWSWKRNPKASRALAKEYGAIYAAEIKRRQDATTALDNASAEYEELRSEITEALTWMGHHLMHEKAAHTQTARRLEAAQQQIRELQESLQKHEAESG